MNTTKTLIIAIVVALIGVVGYTLYLHQGPLENYSFENQNLIKQIDQLKNSHKNELEIKARLQEELGKQKERIGADIQEKVKSLENQLAQKESELQTFRAKTRQINVIEANFQEKIQNLENQLAQKNQDVQTIRNKMRQLLNTIGIMDNKKVTFSQKTVDLNVQLIEAQKHLKELQQTLALKDEKLSRTVDEYQALKKKIDLLEEQRNNLHQNKDLLENKLGKSKSQVQELSQAVASNEERLMTMKKTHKELLTRLNEQIRAKELQIGALEDRLNIRVLDKILFTPGNADITPRGKKVLKKLAEELKNFKDIQISVEGHTDNQPLGSKIKSIYNDNLGLSVARSAEVARKLRTMGVDPQFLSAAGYSMYRPVADNITSEDRQQNRRVEIVLMPLR